MVKLARFRKLRKNYVKLFMKSPLRGPICDSKEAPMRTQPEALLRFSSRKAHTHTPIVITHNPGRRDLAAMTIAGGASSRSRAAAATERFTIYRRVQGGKCAGPDVEAAGCIRSLVATAHKRRSKAAHWLPLPHDRGDDGAKPKAQSTGVLVLVACGAGRPRYPKTNGFRPPERPPAATASPLGR